MTERCLVPVVDAAAVAKAIEAGVGREVRATVGGSVDPRDNGPVVITGRGHILSDGHFVFSDQKSRRTARRMGRPAVIEVGSISVLATERPAFTVDPAFFRSVGLEPREARIVVVMSPFQFRDSYRGFARMLCVVDTPGPSTPRLERLECRHVSRPLYPVDADLGPEIQTTIGAGRGHWRAGRASDGTIA